MHPAARRVPERLRHERGDAARAVRDHPDDVLHHHRDVTGAQQREEQHLDLRLPRTAPFVMVVLDRDAALLDRVAPSPREARRAGPEAATRGSRRPEAAGRRGSMRSRNSTRLPRCPPGTSSPERRNGA